eukprot:469510-Amorphochlora_amoeboformis.AAC.1
MEEGSMGIMHLPALQMNAYSMTIAQTDWELKTLLRWPYASDLLSSEVRDYSFLRSSRNAPQAHDPIRLELTGGKKDGNYEVSTHVERGPKVCIRRGFGTPGPRAGSERG